MQRWLSSFWKRYERAIALFIAAVLATLYVFYGSSRAGIVVASLVIAISLFWLRKIARGLYGAIEVLIGFVAILDASTKGRGALIPNPIDQNPWAHWRSPMDMMRQG